MASVSTDKKTGLRRLQFTDGDGRRQTIRLGRMPKRQAEAVKLRIEHLLTAQLSRQPIDGETSRWVASLDDVLSAKLAKAGLVATRESATLGPFLRDYVETHRETRKPSTVKQWAYAIGFLLEHFGAARTLRSITLADADRFNVFLASRIGDNTRRRVCGYAKQFLKFALRSKLISENPFCDLSENVRPNPSRFYFITRGEADKVLTACPDAEARLLFALCRFGGLRNPSETLLLKWGDIDWEHNRITVHSPKTEHHPGGESRVIPLFPELLEPLQDCWELAEPGQEHIITRWGASCHRMLHRAIQRAGLTSWPKLFQNLRSTRETELAETYPIHVVCAWIGNSPAIAAKHYLQVTDEHFNKAAQNPTQTVHDNSEQGTTAEQADAGTLPVLQSETTGDNRSLHTGTSIVETRASLGFDGLAREKARIVRRQKQGDPSHFFSGPHSAKHLQFGDPLEGRLRINQCRGPVPHEGCVDVTGQNRIHANSFGTEFDGERLR